MIIVFSALAVLLGLFLWGRIRHDIVALTGLFILVLTGVVPPYRAFHGFSHPAVITVAAVLIISRGLQNSGLIEILAGWVSAVGKSFTIQIFILCAIVAAASGFMNNVGALAIMIPVAIRISRKNGWSPSLVLMPLAFASLLGGMTTLIGTPPNLIISAFRAGASGSPFGMFDFSAVGAGLTLAGLLFISLAGWRLLPRRSPKGSKEDLFHIEDYITEVRVVRESKLRGAKVGDIASAADADVSLLGMIRARRRIHAPEPDEILKMNDILIIEADSKDLKDFIESTGVRLVGGRRFRRDAEGAKDIRYSEAVVMGDSSLVGNTAASINMRSRFGVNLLAVARREKQLRQRLDRIRFERGDVLLLQGRSRNLSDAITAMQCLPLADREYEVGRPRRVSLGLGIFGSAILAVVSGFLPVEAAFSIAAVLMVLAGLIPARDMYAAVDWPIIVLLGAMIPVGEALETSGGAALIAGGILRAGPAFPLWVTLAFVMAVTVALSSVINNAATAVLMAPVGIGIAGGLGVSADPFLMAIAVGASCAFLTPIGHQSNTLVMGPGGYKFGDYRRMGIPMLLIVLFAGVPLILFVWPA